MINKPAIVVNSQLETLFLEFRRYSYNPRRSTGIGQQIIHLGENVFDLTNAEKQKLSDLEKELKEITRYPKNAISHDYITETKFALVSKGVGVITSVCKRKNIITLDQLKMLNIVKAVDGGIEGISPVSETQRKSVRYEENE